MKRIPLNAAVACSDGPCGESIRVIVDPKTLQPTHIVVKEAGSGAEYLVAMEHVAEIGQDGVRLNCTKEKLAFMPPFAEVEYRQIEIPRYYGGSEMSAVPTPYSETHLVEVRREHVPEGERAIAQGMEVRASDGKVGSVDELLTDAESGALTHFIMRQKHVWGDKAVVVPLAVIDYVRDDVVYLTPDKETIKSYLAMPARKRRDAEEMELIILLLERPGKPRDMVKAVKDAAKRDGVQLFSTAVLVKDKDGKVAIRESEDLDRRRGAVFGAVTGGLLGLVGGPAGVVIGAAAGAATGGAAAKRIDLGLPDAYLEQLQSKLQPGTAAIVALAEAGWQAKTGDPTFGLEATLLQHQIGDDILDQAAAAQ
jgi:uncharacterized membrane protein